MSESSNEHHLLIAHAVRERRMWSLAFLALWVALAGMALYAVYLTKHLAQTQQVRCLERNADTQAIMDFVERVVPEGTSSNALRERLAPLDCGVYDR